MGGKVRAGVSAGGASAGRLSPGADSGAAGSPAGPSSPRRKKNQTAAASLIFHVRNRQIRWDAAVPAILAGLVTAAGGALAASLLGASMLRKLFGVFLLFVGLSELFRKPKQG